MAQRSQAICGESAGLERPFASEYSDWGAGTLSHRDLTRRYRGRPFTGTQPDIATADQIRPITTTTGLSKRVPCQAVH
jgi:hypothetical protein